MRQRAKLVTWREHECLRVRAVDESDPRSYIRHALHAAGAGIPLLMANWSGRVVAICASGPSMEMAADAIRAESKIIVIAINNTWRLVPNADALFAADASWWLKRNPQLSPLNEEFRGERFVCEDNLVPDATFVPPKLEDGRNSALHAARLACSRLARPILLCGVDLRDDALTHWHGLYEDGLNPNLAMFAQARAAWNRFAHEVTGLVVNCNPDSALTCFPKMAFADALSMRQAA